MKYRKFGKLDWRASILGLGINKMYRCDEGLDLVNDTKQIQLLRYAIDRGVNYLDLGYPFDIVRQQQIYRIINNSLLTDCRSEVKLFLHLPIRILHSIKETEYYLAEQLRWLAVDEVDFCVIDGLNKEMWHKSEETGVIKWAEKALKNGYIGNLGFTFHDDFQVLRNIISGFNNWTFCYFQYSFMDIDHHPGDVGLQYASSNNLAVIVTESLRSGRLTRNIPSTVADIYNNALTVRSPAEWGLRSVWNQPEVTSIVSSIHTLSQLEEDIDTADGAEADGLNIEDLMLISSVRDNYHKLKPIRCTACATCMPCPQNINVPRIFELYNDAVLYSNARKPQFTYKIEQHDITGCIECGICEKRCPRKIAIVDYLKKANLVFTSPP